MKIDMKNSKIKEPKHKMDWSKKKDYKIYKTRIIRTNTDKYRVDGAYKKYWGLIDVWLTLCINDAYDSSIFNGLEDAKKNQKRYIEYYENQLILEKRADTLVEEDVVKSKETHPEYFV